MKPEIVDQAPMPPGQCLFSQDQEGPFIDTGLKAPWVSPYGYLGVNYIEGLARDLLDMVPRKELEVEIKALKDALAAYGQRIEQLEAFVDATVEYQDTRDKETV
jgi:hypothetical protein